MTCAKRLSNLTLWCVVFALLPSMASVSLGQEGKDDAADQKPVLVGRVVDDEGNPVADAKLTLSGPGATPTARTDEQGNYSFPARRRANAPLLTAGEYQVRIKSQRCVGLKNFRTLPRVQLRAGQTVRKNFTLKRAAQVQIQVVNEAGQTVQGATVYYKAVKDEYNAESVSTDATGIAYIGGLAADGGQHVFGCKLAGYGFARVTMKLSEAKSHDVKTIELKKGRSVKGASVCSDGKPPAGWRLEALPLWWKFGIYPNSCSVTIADDGAFELKNIVPGGYRLSISVPMGDSGSTSYPVMSSDLLKAKQPIKVRMKHPSPSSMGTLSGTIEYKGDKKPTQGVWLEAYSMKGRHSGSVHVSTGDKKFKITSLPKGVYRLSAAGREIEPVELKNVRVPGNDLKITLKVRGKLMLKGRVLLPDGKTPATKFKISVTKLRTLSGPGYVQDARWTSVSNAKGEFASEISSSGIYQLTANADGFAPTDSKRFNTTTDKGPLDIVLSKGVSLTGLVVDEAGKPVAGARVMAASLACRDHRGRSKDFSSSEGVVRTDSEGRFQFPNLPATEESLQVTRDGYSVAIVDKLDLSKSVSEPLRVTLSRGGTIRGLVFDATGKRVAGRVLYFQDSQHGGDYPVGQLAKLASNDRGFFQVSNLPPKLIYITCGDEWQTPGVARRTILPQNKKRGTVMFGGPKPTTGLLKINGDPVSNTLVLLTGKDPNFGIMKAIARTGDDGRFRFYGPPPGVWTLHYYKSKTRRSDWGTVAQVELGSKPEDLGAFNLTTGSLTLQVGGRETSGLSEWRVQLKNYNATWPEIGSPVGTLTKWQGNRFVVNDVPHGDFEVVVSRSGYPTFRWRVKVTARESSRNVNVLMPEGTASVTGKVADSIAKPGTAMRFWSAKGDRLGYVKVNDDGSFKAEHLPAGEWLVRTAHTRTHAPVYRFKLKTGEARVLQLTKASVEPKQKAQGAASIMAFTPDGALTPCHVTLTGPTGEVAAQTIGRGRSTFLAPPGDYTASIRLKGFKTVTRPITLKPTDGGTPAADWETRVMLEEAE